MKKPKLKIISSAKEHRLALKAIEALWDAAPGSEDHNSLEVLSLLVEDYEKRTFPMGEPDPVAAIRFRLEQAGKAQKDLVPILGSRSRVSEIMNHKRSLTVDMIRRLFDELHIPMEALIPVRPRRTPPEWARKAAPLKLPKAALAKLQDLAMKPPAPTSHLLAAAKRPR
jgi:HTH-type transcriptional regulator/antitoxin HigA